MGVDDSWQDRERERKRLLKIERAKPPEQRVAEWCRYRDAVLMTALTQTQRSDT